MWFIIKYEWINLDNWMNIKDFWESLIWFSELSKDIFKIWKIRTDVDVKIISVRKWSIVVDIALSIENYINSFSNFTDFLYFIEITNLDFYNEIISKLQEIGKIWIEKWNDLESFNKDYPTIWSIIANWVYDLIKTFLIVTVIFKIKEKNTNNILNTDNIDIWNWKIVKWETLKEIKKIVSKWKWTHFLEPIIEDKVSKINIWEEWNFIEIDNSNFEYFIWEWNEILPELVNWNKYEFIWSFTAMQSNRWETISFSSHQYKYNNNQSFQFNCFLLDWKTTEDYAEFYWNSKELKLTAEVIRVSNYKKPKLKILNVELHQTALDL